MAFKGLGQIFGGKTGVAGLSGSSSFGGVRGMTNRESATAPSFRALSQRVSGSAPMKSVRKSLRDVTRFRTRMREKSIYRRTSRR